MADDYDSPWKEALDAYFEPFLELLFPAVHAQIDWSRGFESLDKEFQKIVREAEVGRRHVDKLVKVWTKEGIECWVLIHVEVQTTRESGFPLRMHVYHYRVFDRYNKPVASLAVLADDDPDWRPAEYSESLFGCELVMRFPTVKLLDFVAREAELEASRNPFAKVVLAHLKTQQTRGNPVDRYVLKLGLIRGLYNCGLGRKDILELLRVIDWMMHLPTNVNRLLLDDVAEIQREKHMPYITSFEHAAHWRGMYKGIKSLLKVRFGEVGIELMPEIEGLGTEESDDLNNLLQAILDKLETASSLEDVRQVWLVDFRDVIDNTQYDIGRN